MSGIPVGTWLGVGYISKKISFVVWKHQDPVFQMLDSNIPWISISKANYKTAVQLLSNWDQSHHIG